MSTETTTTPDSLYGMTAQEMRQCQKHLMLGGGIRGGPVFVVPPLGGIEPNRPENRLKAPLQADKELFHETT